MGSGLGSGFEVPVVVVEPELVLKEEGIGDRLGGGIGNGLRVGIGDTLGEEGLGAGGGRMGVRVPVGIDGSGIGGGPEIEDKLGVGAPDIVKELVPEEPVVLVVFAPALVGADKVEVKLVCDADVDPTGEELEIDGPGWLRLALDRVELTNEEPTDEELVFDGLGAAVLGGEELTSEEPTDEGTAELGIVVFAREELLVGVLVTGVLLGGEGIGITTEMLLELGRETELDRVVSVVSVEDSALDVWLDKVTVKLELELCPDGMMIVVAEDSVVNVVEDWEMLLSPLVVVKTVEIPECVEVSTDDDMPGGEVSVEGPRLDVLKVAVKYVLRMGEE